MLERLSAASVVALFALAGCGGGPETTRVEEGRATQASHAQARGTQEDLGPAGHPIGAARREIAGGALLVCAYSDPRKFEANRVEGAISVAELEDRLRAGGERPRILFYCACPEDASARSRAMEYRDRGYDAGYVVGGYGALK